MTERQRGLVGTQTTELEHLAHTERGRVSERERERERERDRERERESTQLT